MEELFENTLTVATEESAKAVLVLRGDKRVKNVSAWHQPDGTTNIIFECTGIPGPEMADLLARTGTSQYQGRPDDAPVKPVPGGTLVRLGNDDPETVVEHGKMNELLEGASLWSQAVVADEIKDWNKLLEGAELIAGFDGSLKDDSTEVVKRKQFKVTKATAEAVPEGVEKTDENIVVEEVKEQD